MITQEAAERITIKPYAELHDLESIAIDINDGFMNGTNDDIALDFKEIAPKYQGDIWHVKNHLEDIQAICRPAIREQFIIFAGPRAVGVAMVAPDEITPKSVDPSWPNVSLFLFNPHRSKGIGALTMQRQLQAVNENFNGHAWTIVRRENTKSQRLVTHAGFVPHSISKKTGKILYLYGK